MEFKHISTEYRVTKCLNAPVYLFYALKGTHASYLFSTQIKGRVTVKTCIQELSDRAAQRQSALNNTFHLEVPQ